MSLVQRTEFGLHVPGADLYLDARRAPGLVFVSHAHSDHCSRAPRIVCTRETAALHRSGRKQQEKTTLAYGEHMQLGSATLELRPAGHTLGSAMAIVRTGAGTVAYTGDYKLRDGAYGRGVKPPACDTLVMECTFGNPRYRFPAEAVLMDQLCRFIDQTLGEGAVPVVLGYGFGKAQEALYHLTSRGYYVAVEDRVADLCFMHVALGYAFPGPGQWTRIGDADKSRVQVVLATPGAADRVTIGKRLRTVYLTGWACHPAARRRFRGFDLVLPFSGHADFDELVRTARESGAAKIYTVHGAPAFAAHLRTLGLDAEHLGAHPQNTSQPVKATPRGYDPAVPPPKTVQLALALG